MLPRHRPWIQRPICGAGIRCRCRNRNKKGQLVSKYWQSTTTSAWLIIVAGRESNFARAVVVPCGILVAGNYLGTFPLLEGGLQPLRIGEGELKKAYESKLVVLSLTGRASQFPRKMWSHILWGKMNHLGHPFFAQPNKGLKSWYYLSRSRFSRVYSN